MNAKWLIALGLLSLLVLAGCPEGGDGGASNDTRETMTVGEGDAAGGGEASGDAAGGE